MKNICEIWGLDIKKKKNMMMMFWIVLPNRLIARFRHLTNGDSMFLWNTVIYLQVFKASQLRRATVMDTICLIYFTLFSLPSRCLFFSFFPVPVCAITASVVPGGTFVSMNRFSTLCGWLPQRQGWRVKGWIWQSEQPRSAKANSWLDYQMGNRKW
jgi:hypothetical protein